MPVDTEKLMVDKRLVRVSLWFVVDNELVRVAWCDGEAVPTIPEDGFLCGKGQHACHGRMVQDAPDAPVPPKPRMEQSQENIGGDGWLVLGMTKHGLLCQTTGGDKPDPARYPGCQFSRCKLAPSTLMHVAAEEMQQWR